MKRRLAALEHNPSEPVTFFAKVPAEWSDSKAAKAIEAEMLAQGFEASFITFAMRKKGVEGVAIVGAERWGDLIDYVAKHGKRIGAESLA